MFVFCFGNVPTEPSAMKGRGTERLVYGVGESVGESVESEKMRE